MIEFEIKPFLEMQDVLAQASLLLQRSPRIPGLSRDQLIAQLEELDGHLGAPEFHMCRLGAERLRQSLERTADAYEITGDVNDLRRRLLDQATAIFCLSLTSGERELYAPEAHPFGKDVGANFPSANEDVYEACKCLALGRSTACVMHLMRACEVALKGLASALEVSEQGDWGSYLRKIAETLEKRGKTASKRSADEQFFSEAAANFEHLKRAWRNPTMHVDKTYSTERAGEILSAVRSFMGHLATKICEPEIPF